MSKSDTDSEFYIFECFLPFAISLPPKTELDLTYKGFGLRFVHAERHVSRDLNFELAPHAQVPGDKFGIFARSRVALVFNVDALRNTMSDEEAEVFDLDAYFTSLFFNPSHKSTGLVVGAINRVLKLVRVVFGDWHASSITPKDLANLRFLKQADQKTIVLGLSYFSHQLVSFESDASDVQRRLGILSDGFLIDSDLEPLAVMECEIHDHANRGDYYLSVVLMGTFVELAIKKTPRSVSYF